MSVAGSRGPGGGAVICCAGPTPGGAAGDPRTVTILAKSSARSADSAPSLESRMARDPVLTAADRRRSRRIAAACSPASREPSCRRNRVEGQPGFRERARWSGLGCPGGGGEPHAGLRPRERACSCGSLPPGAWGQARMPLREWRSSAGGAVGQACQPAMEAAGLQRGARRRQRCRLWRHGRQACLPYGWLDDGLSAVPETRATAFGPGAGTTLRHGSAGHGIMPVQVSFPPRSPELTPCRFCFCSPRWALCPR